MGRDRARIGAVTVAASAALAFASGSARADERCDPAIPAIEAIVDGDVAIDRERLLRLLEIDLASRGLQLCASGGPKPIAVIRLAAHEGDATLTIEVRDRITAKEVKRDVPLGSYPEDARPLLVAVAMDELLRASWVELTLKDAPPPAEPPPKAVTDVVHDTVIPPASAPRAPRVRIGARAAVDHFAEGATLVGGDVAFALWLVPRVALSLRLSLRGGVTAEATNGRVSPSLLGGALGAAVTLTPPAARAGLDATLHVGVARVAFGATATEGARAIPQSEATALVDLGLEGWLALGPWVRLFVDASWVQPLRPVRALDGTTTVVGVGGPGFGGGLGACATF